MFRSYVQYTKNTITLKTENNMLVKKAINNVICTSRSFELGQFRNFYDSVGEGDYRMCYRISDKTTKRASTRLYIVKIYLDGGEKVIEHTATYNKNHKFTFRIPIISNDLADFLFTA